MAIQLKPETEALIEQDVLHSGRFQSATDFVEEAVALLHGQEKWLAENRAAIESMIAEGYEAARQGRLRSEEEVRARVAEHKRKWRSGACLDLDAL